MPNEGSELPVGPPAPRTPAEQDTSGVPSAARVPSQRQGGSHAAARNSERTAVGRDDEQDGQLSDRQARRKARRQQRRAAADAVLPVVGTAAAPTPPAVAELTDLGADLAFDVELDPSTVPAAEPAATPGARLVRIGSPPPSPPAQLSPRRIVVQRPPSTIDAPRPSIHDAPVVRRVEAAPQPGGVARPVVLAALAAVAAMAATALVVNLADSDDNLVAAVQERLAAAGQAASEPPGEQSGAQQPSAGGSPAAPPTEGGSGAATGSPEATPGLVASAALLSGDLVEVTEVVTWPDGGPGEIRLELPDLSSGSEVEAGFDPAVTSLQVTLDGNAVPAVPSGVPAAAWVVQSPSGIPPATMTVRYVLDGALLRSTPSQAGRALALIAPISQGVIGSLPLRIDIAYEGVLSVGCPRAVDPAGQVCGRRLEDRWTAEPPPGVPAVVVVQVDLPPLLG